MWEIETDSAGVYLVEGKTIIHLGTKEEALQASERIRTMVGGEQIYTTGVFDWMTRDDAYDMANRINPDKFPLDREQPYGNQPLAARIRNAIYLGHIETNGRRLIKRTDFIRWMQESAREPRTGDTADE